MNIAPAAPATTTAPVLTPQETQFATAYTALSNVQQTVQGFADLYAHGGHTTSQALTNAALDAQRAAELFAPFDWPQAQAAHSAAIDGALQLHVAAAQARGEYAGNVDENVRASVEHVSQQLSYVLHINGH